MTKGTELVDVLENEVERKKGVPIGAFTNQPIGILRQADRSYNEGRNIVSNACIDIAMIMLCWLVQGRSVVSYRA